MPDARTTLSSCARCGTGALNNNARFCRRCGDPLPMAAATRFDVQRTGGVPQPIASRTNHVGPSTVVVIAGKSSGLAAVLSFFWCGLGQIYNGQIGKGLAMMAAHPILLVLGLMISFFGGCSTAAVATTPDERGAAGAVFLLGLLLLSAAFALWVFGMVNAYRSAERANQQQVVLGRY